MAVSIPHLRETAVCKQLVVNRRPFLILGGELQNSSSSSSEYMHEIWDNMKESNYNTLLASVAWEQIEPVERQFHFEELDKLILSARAHDLHLILLWFGSFKNGLSTYAPAWVKTNAKRFPRAKLQPSGTKVAGKRLATGDVLSVFSHESHQADAKAFKVLMEHLKIVDEEYSTVIMVQVENEVGLLGDSRDRCALAEEAYDAPIPAEFLDFLRRDCDCMNYAFRSHFQCLKKQRLPSTLTWAQLSGDSQRGDELFMAYHYASYVNRVASAGKSAYPIPLFTNVWQNYGDEDRDMNAPLVAAGGSAPGDYPSGGGVAHVLDVWQTFATSLDFIAPDIYLNDYSRSCEKYRHRNQPLFIPEQRRDAYGALRIWPAFGSYQAIGTAPFGVDTVLAKDSPFTKHYALLAKASELVLAAQARKDSSIGFFFDELSIDGTDPSAVIHTEFGNWILTIERAFVFGRPSQGCGMVIHLGEDEFLLLGWGFQVKYQSRKPDAHFAGILSFEEKDIDERGLRTVRLLNGDETRSGQAAVMPSEDPDYGGFPISITIPARTGIAVCKVYALVEE